MLQNATLSGNQRPDLLTSLMNMSLASFQILFKCPTPAIVFGNATKPSRLALFWQGAESLAPATQNQIWTFKTGPSMWCFLHFDVEMCFPPLNGVHFFNMWTSKSSPRMVCFAHFDAFWLGNVLRAATARTFPTSQLPLRILTCKCATRHSGVHFFDISTSRSAPNRPVFNTFDFQMCFAPQRRALFRHHNFQKCAEPTT